MSSKRIRRTAAAEPPSDETGEPIHSEAQSEGEVASNEIQEVAQQLPQGARGSLQRFIEGGEREWCEDLAAPEFSPARVRAKWGPGRYIVYWRKPHDTHRGKTVSAGTTRFLLAAGAEDPAAGRAATPAGAVTDMVIAHTKSMLDGQQMLQQMQMAVLKNLTEPRHDSTGELLKLILPELIRSVATRTPAGPDLGAIIALADKLANRTSPTTAMKETLELLDKARELAGGEGDGAPPWMRLAAGALDTIGRALARPAGEPPALPVGEPPAPAPAEPAALPAGPTPESSPLPSTAHAIFHFLAPHIPALLRHAQLDHDPTTYGGVIFDQLQPQYFAEVRDYISRPDFLDLLEAHFPALRGATVEGSEPPVLVRAWFGELRDELVSRIHDELEPPAPPELPPAQGVLGLSLP